MTAWHTQLLKDAEKRNALLAEAELITVIANKGQQQ